MDGHTAPTRHWRPQTKLVRGGQERSGFEETSEAIYATSGFVYGTAEQAEEAFANRLDRYIYSRYANPTLTMLEERLALLEGAEACATTSSAAAFSAMKSTRLPALNAAAIRLTMVCDLPVPGGPCTARSTSSIVAAWTMPY